MALEYNIVETLCTISERDGWAKEVNVVSWNHREPKLDIREWNADHTKMTKGITLTEDEAVKLAITLYNYATERSKICER